MKLFQLQVTNVFFILSSIVIQWTDDSSWVTQFMVQFAYTLNRTEWTWFWFISNQFELNWTELNHVELNWTEPTLKQ